MDEFDIENSKIRRRHKIISIDTLLFEGPDLADKNIDIQNDIDIKQFFIKLATLKNYCYFYDFAITGDCYESIALKYDISVENAKQKISSFKKTAINIWREM